MATVNISAHRAPAGNQVDEPSSQKPGTVVRARARTLDHLKTATWAAALAGCVAFWASVLLVFAR